MQVTVSKLAKLVWKMEDATYEKKNNENVSPCILPHMPWDRFTIRAIIVLTYTYDIVGEIMLDLRIHALMSNIINNRCSALADMIHVG